MDVDGIRVGERQTDGQTDGQTDRDRDRQRQRQRQTDRGGVKDRDEKKSEEDESACAETNFFLRVASVLLS
jgi:hypothetical protein